MNNYDIEVKQRFGETDAFKEHAEKTANYTADKWQEVNDGLNAVFTKFAECNKNGHTADSDEAQALVIELQNYITENYYTCTNEILQVSVKCTSAMNASKTTSIRVERALRNSLPKPSEFIVRSKHKTPPGITVALSFSRIKIYSIQK